MSNDPLKVFWQPGCTSCLRAKEFLRRHGVTFESVNVMADPAGFEEMAKLGLRTVPIVARGTDWVNGQVLSDVARIAGISLDNQQRLTPAELERRAQRVIAVASTLAPQIPEDRQDTPIPNRPQTYRQLSAHIFQVIEAFLDYVEHGRRLEFAAYLQDVPQHVRNKDDLATLGRSIGTRLSAWFGREGHTRDFAAPADVYYGEQTLGEFFERTCWHAAQHTRQLYTIVERLALTPLDRLTDEDLAGLPLPRAVWDELGDASALEPTGAAPIGWTS